MDFSFTAEAGLAGLFLASFLAATLLPGGSEAVFAAILLAHPDQAAVALLLATIGNTAGGMTTYAMGRLLPQHIANDAGVRRHFETLRRHGAPVLLLAWAPIVGDALCAAAGWLRLPWLPCTLWMATGKCSRYAVIAAGLGAVAI